MFASACLIYMFVSFSNVGGFYFSTPWPPFTDDSHLYFLNPSGRGLVPYYGYFFLIGGDVE